MVLWNENDDDDGDQCDQAVERLVASFCAIKGNVIVGRRRIGFWCIGGYENENECGLVWRNSEQTSTRQEVGGWFGRMGGGNWSTKKGKEEIS